LEGRISKPPLDKENKLKERSWEAYQKKGSESCVFFRRKKKENECGRGKLVFMCERMLFMKKMCANKEHERKLCVASSCSGVHGRISMNNPLDSYLK
jgi:hypothetical protein